MNFARDPRNISSNASHSRLGAGSGAAMPAVRSVGRSFLFAPCDLAARPADARVRGPQLFPDRGRSVTGSLHMDFLDEASTSRSNDESVRGFSNRHVLKRENNRAANEGAEAPPSGDSRQGFDSRVEL